MIGDAENGRLITTYVLMDKFATAVQPTDVDMRNAIGWVDGQRWMMVEIGGYTPGNETNAGLTVMIGAFQVASVNLAFGSLVFDSAGSPGFGFSREASRPVRTRMPRDWDGLLTLTPKIRIGADLFPPGAGSAWNTSASVIGFVTVQRLRQRPPPPGRQR